MKYSIIVPVFNTNLHYLQECIDSILNQTYSNFEIIIVDDGSNQITKNILTNIEKKDKRIRLIKQEHKGVSYARNNATLNATGSYIMYVDADDMISPYFLESANNILKQKKLDLLLAQITFRKELLEERDYNYDTNENIIKDLRKYYLSFHNQRFKDKEKWINRGPVARLIKLDIAKSNLFDSSISFGEDVLWNLDLLEKINQVGILKMPVYYYRKNPNSTTAKYHQDFNHKLSDLVIKIKEKITSKRENLNYEFALAAFEYYRIYLKLDLCHKNNPKSKKEKYLILKEISDLLLSKTDILKVRYQSFPWKQKIILFLLKHRLYKIILMI